MDSSSIDIALFRDGKSHKLIQLSDSLISLIYIFVIIIFLFTDTDGALMMIFWYIIIVFLNKILQNSENYQDKIQILYLPLIFILAIIEETPIYYTGGGLAGEALSLQHDLIIAIPIFLGIGLGIYLVQFKRKLLPSEVFFIAAILGSWAEAGAGFLLATAGSFYYGSMMAAGSWNRKEEESHGLGKSIINIVIGVIVAAIFMILGAIVADNLYKIVGP